jgi:hypothetical protein
VVVVNFKWSNVVQTVYLKHEVFFSFIAPRREFDCVGVAVRGEDVLDKRLDLRF